MKHIAILLAAAISFTAYSEDAAMLFEQARTADDAAQFDKALALYLQADSAFVAENRASTPEYAQSLHNTGRAFLNINDIEKGREYTLKAANLRERLFGKVSKEYITSFNNYALSFLISGNPEQAIEHQTQVIELCRRMSPPHPDEGMYLINLGRAYSASGDRKNAVKYMEEALPKVEKFCKNYEVLLELLGNEYMELEDNANLNRILGLMEEHNCYELQKECHTPECHLERAEYYMATGNQAKAKEEYMIVFDMPLTDSQQVDAYQKYAKFLFDIRDFAQSGEYYAMAAAAAEKAGGVSEKAALILYKAGVSSYLGKEFDKAISTQQRVIAAVDSCGFSDKLKDSALHNLGNTLSAKMDFGAAFDVYRQRLQLLVSLGHKADADYAKALVDIASAEKHNGDYDASIADYKEAIELFGKLEMFDEQQQASDGLTMCLVLAKKNPDDNAENVRATEQRQGKIHRILKSSLDLLEQSGDYLGKLSTAQTYATIAGCYGQLEDYPAAIDYYAKYIEALRPALAEAFILKNPKERELAWSSELDNISQMGELIMNLPQNTPDLYARLSTLIFEGQLMSKGILLSSNIEFDKIISRYGTGEMKEQYEVVKAGIAEIERMKENHMPAEDILRRTRETDALQLSLARESAKYGIYTDFLNITSADIAAALGSEDVAIEFVTLPAGILPDEHMIAAVLISSEFPSGITIPIMPVGQMKSIINDKQKFGNDMYAAAVWSGILQFAQGKKRVFFAPDGVLNNIGIEYLTFEGVPMSEYFEIHRVSSTRELVREHPASQIQYAALFGDIDYIGSGTPASDKKKYARRASDGLSFGRLESTAREINEIKSILKKNTSKSHIVPYTGVKASKAEFLSQADVPVNLLHIATHGKYVDEADTKDADAMSRSILAFAGAGLHNGFDGNDGVVTAADIASMTLQDCDLVVLSACESGLGKLADDGVFGLQRGFKNAGVKSLLVSLNEVADNTTADMMISFYRNLFADGGCSKTEALRKAQAEIRAKNPSDDTWASFILIDSF